nr:formate--tetrahydrofolate ligase [Bacteroidales bacterium]
MKSDIAIAQEAKMKPISEIGKKAGIEDVLVPYGRFLAKVPLTSAENFENQSQGKLILVTAMTPTPLGEGKTTNTIGLAQALAQIGKK